MVDPANEFGPLVASKGIPVAEFNIEKTVATKDFRYAFFNTLKPFVSSLYFILL